MSQPHPDPEETADDLRLAEALERYHQQLAAGNDPDPEALQSAHPELSESLGECLQGLGALAELRNALSQSEEPFAPRRLGHFELLRELGRGGMGVVYEARQLDLGRRVALKLLSATRNTPADRQRFRREREAVARLQHPNIVPIYEVGELDGELYFTMEYIDGPSLADRLSEGPLPLREAVEIVRRIALAIEHAHAQGILHRDLKPANILLQKNPESRIQNPGEKPAASDHPLTTDNRHLTTAIPKVTDFGLAKLEGDLLLTQSGDIVGTPSYMPPEQAAGHSNRVGVWSDVYSLGAILYEVLTGRAPFLGASMTETLEQVRHQEPVPPERLNYRIPFELSTICLKCLQKEPQHRYASAHDLAGDLLAFLEGRPIKARPDSLLTRLQRALRQEPHPDVLQRRQFIGSSKAWASLLICLLVTGLNLLEVDARWIYGLLVLGGVFLVFWEAPRPNDTLVERQVSSVWRAFLLGSLVTALLNLLMGLKPLQLSPVIAVLGGVANFVMADLLSGWFYVGAILCFLAAVLMVYATPYDFLILGAVFFVTLIVPRWKYGGR